MVDVEMEVGVDVKMKVGVDVVGMEAGVDIDGIG